MNFYVTFRSGKNFNFHGDGTLYLYDTFLIIEGNMPKFRIPLMDWAYQEILFVQSMLTVPYAVITKYHSSKSSFGFKIVYQLPDGHTRAIPLWMQSSHDQDMLSTQLEQYMAMAKSLTVE